MNNNNELGEILEHGLRDYDISCNKEYLRSCRGKYMRSLNKYTCDFNLQVEEVG